MKPKWILAAIAIVSCAGCLLNYGPRYSSPNVSLDQQARVVGFEGWRTGNYLITCVDGLQTLMNYKLPFPSQVQLAAGPHHLGLLYQNHGFAYLSYPSVIVEAGRTYQLKFSVDNDPGTFWLEDESGKNVGGDNASSFFVLMSGPDHSPHCEQHNS